MADSEMGAVVDLTNCDREPIHIPGAVQPHGALLALNPADLTVLQVSDNLGALLGVSPADALGRPIGDLLRDTVVERLRQALALTDLSAVNPLELTVPVDGKDRAFHGVLHRSGGQAVLELEPAPDATGAFFGFYHQVRGAMARMQQADSLLNLCQIAVEEVRRLAGFDRVMVYRFDADWNGRVLAEEKRATMASYLDLHFPASDIPAQARELYRRNWLRFVVDARYQPAALVPPDNPLTGRPLDLSFSMLRSVSPIHLEYLRNMGVQASLSVSILKGNDLWGLIACHHAEARFVPYETRAACEFLGQMLSSQLAIREEAEEYEYAARLRAVRERIVAAASSLDRVGDGLRRESRSLLELTEADGAAVCFDGELHLVGDTPTADQVRRLLEWLVSRQTAAIFSTNELPRHFGEAQAYADRASGLLALLVSRSRGEGVLWFRPEAARTVTWAGNPHKPVAGPGGGRRLHPRTSFAHWQETVRGAARPWAPPEREAAQEMGHVLTALALRGAAREMAHLNAELTRRNQDLDAFAYVASHDLKAPLRGISQLADWIEEDLEGALSEESREYLAKMRGRVKRMQGLIEGILEYSRAGRVALPRETFAVADLLSDVVDLLAPPPGVSLTIAPDLPVLTTERLPLQQVFLNLLSNAIKHNSRPDGHIWVTVRPDGRFVEFAVRDDGPGIDPQYHERIFGIFQTLKSRDDFESTGVGLALIKKIVERQGGRVRVESQPGKGATFLFTWPHSPLPSSGTGGGNP